MELGNDESNIGRWVDDQMATIEPSGDWQPNVARGLALLGAQQTRRRGHRRRWAWIAAGAMATCVSVMATPVTRAFAQRCLSACVSESGWVRQFLTVGGSGPVATSAYIKPENRGMAPDFTLRDRDGKPVQLSQFRGDVVLLNFWATWCAPCREEIPFFIGFQQTYRDRGFVALGVALDDDGWNAVKPYADAKKINYPVLVGDDKIAERFGGLKAVPTTFIIDRQGRIAATHVGLCQRSEYENDIRAVLKETGRYSSEP
jgi:cytochrome c biogenesis protein CcmG/thiol:disulfide interchange protein DsbE